MSVNDNVSCVWDKIQVKYRVEKGELVWWPATVLSSREYEAPGVVAGTGTVEFATYRNTRKTIEDVTFLAERTVATSGGETAWRSSAEAADAGGGNEEEADWNPRARARAARALRGSSPEARVEYRIRIGDEDDSTRKDDGEEDVDDAEETDDEEIEEPPSQRRRIDCNLAPTHSAQMVSQFILDIIGLRQIVDHPGNRAYNTPKCDIICKVLYQFFRHWTI